MRVTSTPAQQSHAGNRHGLVWLAALWLSLCPALAGTALAASYEFLSIETVFNDAPPIRQVQPLAIVVISSRQRFDRLPRNTQNALKNHFVYQTRGRIDGTVYFRLVIGNFGSTAEAQDQLKKLRPVFTDAWVYRRDGAERQALAQHLKTLSVNTEKSAAAPIPETDEERLQKVREAFLDENYTRVISLANRVIQQGSPEQSRSALELAGAARERQGRYAQAMVMYQTLLDTDPAEELAARIKGRMEGIRTMSIEPRARLQASEKKPDDDSWIVRGVLQQYYQDDVIEQSGEGSETINQLLATDIDLLLLRRTETTSLAIEIDAGLIADLMDDGTDGRVSRANLSYTRDDYRIIGGRQHRTVKGVYGRFDGFTYVDLARSGYQISYFGGTLARSSYDGLQTEQPLVGVNIDFSPYDWLDVNLYLVHQEISGLTDRQAIGSEFQIRNPAGFIYGIVDYDLFYEDLNNIRFISSYRQSRQWTFNLTLDLVKAPPLSTVNALQGQAVDSIEDLNDIYSEDQIYQLAQDRTGDSQSLYFGSIYTIDNNRQLYLDFSIHELDEIPASGGVSKISATRDTSISADYSVRNLYSSRDYSSMGIRLSDSDTSEILSLRFRSTITGNAALRYDPRIQLDFRQSSAGVDQTILRPSLKLRYRAGKKLNLEADFGIEYSDVDLPDFDQQTAYSLYLGYAYIF